MATLTEDVLALVLRRAYEFDWDEVDMDRELERRRFLSNTAIVSRAWTGPSAAVLGETIVARQLEDFDAVHAAAEAGTLRLEGVRTVVLDERACREPYGGAMTREDSVEASGGREDRRAIFDCCELASLSFSVEAYRLVHNLPGLQQVRSIFARTIFRLQKPWPLRRLAVLNLVDRQAFLEDQTPDRKLWSALGRDAKLVALSIFRITQLDDHLRPIPRRLCNRLRSLRIGVVDGRENERNECELGVSLFGSLFAGPTPELRSLDIRLSRAHRAAGGGDDEAHGWTERILGGRGGEMAPSALNCLAVGWPSPQFDVAGALELVKTAPASVRHLTIVSGCKMALIEPQRFLGFDLISALDGVLGRREHAVGLVELELDLSGFGLEADVWRAHQRWQALEVTCAERGVALVLTVDG